jgi:hypothetical protein
LPPVIVVTAPAVGPKTLSDQRIVRVPAPKDVALTLRSITGAVAEPTFVFVMPVTTTFQPDPTGPVYNTVPLSAYESPTIPSVTTKLVAPAERLRAGTEPYANGEPARSNVKTPVAITGNDKSLTFV